MGYLQMERDALLLLCRHACCYRDHMRLVKRTIEMIALRNGYADVTSYLDFHKLSFFSDWFTNCGTVEQLVSLQVSQ